VSWLDYYCSCQLPGPIQMKKTLNKLWPALAESKLAVALLAGLFVAAVIFLSVPTQFAVRGTNGEPVLYELYDLRFRSHSRSRTCSALSSKLALLRGSSGDGGAGSPAPGEETSGHELPPLGELPCSPVEFIMHDTAHKCRYSFLPNSPF
jgi:hypothetical protein